MEDFRLNPGDWVHFVAIGGTGMGALASLLKDQGCKVTGSDGPLYPPMSTFLKDQNVLRQEAYMEENLYGESWGFSETFPKLVIVGNAISRGHIEAQKIEDLLKQKLIAKRMSFAEALAHFAIRDRRSLVVAGTHGKTTTTTLLAWAAEELGLQPGFFIGGIPKNFSFGSRMGTGKLFISEGDEYDTAYWDKESKFLHYRPSWVLCTGIEFDHADIFSSIEQIEESFLKLTLKTKEGWILIDAESAPRKSSVERIARFLNEKNIPCLRYGKAESSAYRLLATRAAPLPWRPDQFGTEITIRVSDDSSSLKGELKFYSPMIGEHNALNVLGVVAVLSAAGQLKTEAEIQKFLKSFAGVKRRQEEVFVSPELVVIDDFAHHPTAIRETVKAMKLRYPAFKLAAFFEPRSATAARKVLAQEFSECFDEADAVFLSAPTKTNVPVAEKLDIYSLLSEIKARKNNAAKHIVVQVSADDLVKDFKGWTQKNSREKILALVMSNGPFGGIHQKLSAAAVPTLAPKHYD